MLKEEQKVILFIYLFHVNSFVSHCFSGENISIWIPARYHNFRNNNQQRTYLFEICSKLSINSWGTIFPITSKLVNLFVEIIWMGSVWWEKWDKVSSGLSKFCGRQALKNFQGYSLLKQTIWLWYLCRQL